MPPQDCKPSKTDEFADPFRASSLASSHARDLCGPVGARVGTCGRVYLRPKRERTFFRHQKLSVLTPFFVALLLLFVLYLVRIRAPWNWLMLLLFSVAQSVLFAGLGVAFDANLGFSTVERSSAKY